MVRRGRLATQALLQALLGLYSAAYCCLLEGSFTNERGTMIISKQESNSLVSFLNDAQDKEGWVVATGTLSKNGSRWCTCGAGGSCTSSEGLCRELTVTFIRANKSVAMVLNGTVELDCQGVTSWSNGYGDWWKPDPSIKELHIVSMTHLDVGFTNTTHSVCDMYFEKHFPQAIETHYELKARGGAETYTWTVFPWLLLEFFDGAAGCARRRRTEQEMMEMKVAIESGAIIWQANALNSFMELYDETLLDYSLSLRHELNAMFAAKSGLLAGKQTDVPGMSIAAVPVLHKKGKRRRARFMCDDQPRRAGVSHRIQRGL